MKRAIILIMILTILTACAPQKQPQTPQALAEKIQTEFLVTPATMTIGISEGFQNILVTYKNPGTSAQKSVEPKIFKCLDKTGNDVNFILLSSKPRDLSGAQVEVYQLTISSTKEAKYGTYSCVMGVSIGGQMQDTPLAPFIVTIRQ